MDISASPPSDGFAIIAYLHSGDFSNGSPFEINPFQLVFKQKVIVITIAYRLNILGFFTTLDGESPGNYGLMDQSAALLWIKRNAKAFGGNEDNITLMGVRKVKFRRFLAVSNNFYQTSMVQVPHQFVLT